MTTQLRRQSKNHSSLWCLLQKSCIYGNLNKIAETIRNYNHLFDINSRVFIKSVKNLTDCCEKYFTILWNLGNFLEIKKDRIFKVWGELCILKREDLKNHLCKAL